MKKLQKVAIIGNGGGGKTTLSRSIAKRYNLEITHVDSIQFLSGLKVRDKNETNTILTNIARKDEWLIDGFGSLEVIFERFELAEIIIFVDFPIWRHQWWAFKRQVKSLWKTRSELPEGCSERGIKKTLEMYKIIKRVHTDLIPKFKTYIENNNLQSKTLYIKNVEDWINVKNSNLLNLLNNFETKKP
jgi:adenylate kinase family enzyme